MRGSPVVAAARAGGYIPGLAPRSVKHRGLLFALGVATVAGLCLPFSIFAMFSIFQQYDDEGYLLISLRHYAQGGILYDQLYSQYGPAYFQLLTAAFGLAGLEFTHTASRAFVIVLWTAVAALCGVATYRLTRNVPVAICTQLLVFLALVPLRDEPPHPGGVLCLILSAIVLAGSYFHGPHAGAAAVAIGALLAAATLMKINVGLFALVSIAFALLAAADLGPGWGILRLAAAGAFLAVPPGIMVTLLAKPWVRSYLTVVLCAALAVVLVRLNSQSRSAGAVRRLVVVLVSFAITSAMVGGWELARGTSAAGLLRGIVLNPIRHGVGFSIPLSLPPYAVGWALASLVLSVIFVLGRRVRATEHRATVVVLGVAQVLSGALIWLAASQLLPLSPLAVSLPLLWMALTTPGPPADAERQLGKSLLVTTAVLQSLHAYPAAASQVSWATFLFVPVGAIAIADGWSSVVTAVQRSARIGARRWVGVSALLATAMVALTARPVYEKGQQFRSTYDAGVPLDLPGAERIRVPPRQAEIYRRLTESLTAHCGTFVTMPGLNSLYLFSRLEPPTMMNTTLWMVLLDGSQQARIAERLSSATVPVCAVRTVYAASITPRLGSPLARYIDEQFITMFTLDDYQFMVRRTGENRS